MREDTEAAIIMAGLLPAVETIEPDRLEERLWLTAAVRGSISQLRDMLYVRPTVVQAMVVSRYDRALADAIMAPVLERLPEMVVDSWGFNNPEAELTKSLAAYDPRAVAALLQALPGSARKAPAARNDWNAASLDARIRLNAAEVLGLSLEERRRNVFGGGSPLHLLGWVR